MNCSVPAPPPSDANPPPCPAWSRTAAVRINASKPKRISSRLYIAPGNYLRHAGLHKLRPALGIERRSTHQHAVQFVLREQLGDVLRVHAAAVQHPGRGGAAPAAATLRRVSSSVSPNTWRRSEWPTSVARAPAWRASGAETAPVKAPLGSQ